MQQAPRTQSEIVLVDDDPDNIHVAKAEGMHTVWCPAGTGQASTPAAIETAVLSGLSSLPNYSGATPPGTPSAMLLSSSPPCSPQRSPTRVPTGIRTTPTSAGSIDFSPTAGPRMPLSIGRRYD